jgi:hypothetical protein
MWLAFMLILTIFHHPKAKNVGLASFLALTKKKDACEMASLIFFLARKLAKQKFFALE